jgi:nucleoside-diphosphate-sugar epimerase
MSNQSIIAWGLELDGACSPAPPALWHARRVTRWAVSGGSGFLGAGVAGRLLAEGAVVRTLDPRPPPAALGGVDWIEGDVRRPVDAARLCAGADVLVHAAATLPIGRDQAQIRSVTVEGTATLLAAASEAGVRRVVFVSSAVVYGLPRELPLTEGSPPAPFEAYGRAKLAAEDVCRAFGRRGLEVVVLRPTAFLGPGRLGVFGILFSWISEGRRLYLLGRGENRYQLLALDDLLDAVLLAAARPVAGETFVLAAQAGTVREELEALVARAGSSSRVTGFPAGPARAALALAHACRLSPLGAWHYRTADRDVVLEPAKARRLLGWAPRSSTGEALFAAYEWYAANRGSVGPSGTTHLVPWDEGALALLRRAS